MPEELVKKIMAQIDKGKIPAFCKKKGLKGSKCAHAWAATIENAMKSRQAAKGGELEELLKTFGNYSQIPSEDEIIVEEDGIWLLAADKNTHLNLIDGRSLPVSEIAHMVALHNKDWLETEIEGHIDHRPDKPVKIDIKEARYDLDRGLYLKVDTKDDDIFRGLADGSIRPSIETSAQVVDDAINVYIPTGVGLMVERQAMGDHVGPEAPPVEAIGGEIVTEEQTKDPDPAPEADPKADPPPKEEPPKVETKPKEDPPKEKVKGEDEYKTKYEELLSKMEGNEAYVKELKETYVSKLPEDLHEHARELPMDELKTLVALSNAIRADFEDRLEKIDTRVAPIIKERDDIKSAEKKTEDTGAYTDEAWAIVKARQSYAMGRPVPKRVEDILGEDGLKKVRKEIDEARKLKI
jgi:hypothetical protein